VTHQQQQDPQDLSWAGLAWSEWYQLDSAAARAIPREAGVYRLRCCGEPGLICIGISARLSSRLGGLRRARRRQDKRGHYAAACVAAHEETGKTVEVSWA